jgi:hypothetical protein
MRCSISAMRTRSFSDSSVRNSVVPAASWVRVSTFFCRYSVTRSFATRAASSGRFALEAHREGDGGARRAAGARVHDVGADHLALHVLAHLLDELLAGHVLALVRVQVVLLDDAEQVREVITRWLITCTRSSAKLVTAERTKSSGTSCCSIRIVPMER